MAYPKKFQFCKILLPVWFYETEAQFCTQTPLWIKFYESATSPTMPSHAHIFTWNPVQPVQRHKNTHPHWCQQETDNYFCSQTKSNVQYYHINNTNCINHSRWCSFVVVDCCFVAQRDNLAQHSFNMMSHPTMVMVILVQQWPNFDQKNSLLWSG
jgi:hypothetical protein